MLDDLGPSHILSLANFTDYCENETDELRMMLEAIVDSYWGEKAEYKTFKKPKSVHCDYYCYPLWGPNML